MLTSGCRPWLKNVACLSSLILEKEESCVAWSRGCIFSSTFPWTILWGWVTKEVNVQVFNNIFILLKNSEFWPKMITCVKEGPRRRDVGKVCRADWRIPLLLLQWAKWYLARSLVEKHVLGTGPNTPHPSHLFYHYPRCVHDEILVKAKAGTELIPKWGGLRHS